MVNLVGNILYGQKNFRFQKLKFHFPPLVWLHIIPAAVVAVSTSSLLRQVLGHSRVEIYERYYQSQKERKSIQAAYLETPEDEAFLRALGTMSLTRDHNAPRELSKEQIEAVERDPELV
jgi:hypothetical protein